MSPPVGSARAAWSCAVVTEPSSSEAPSVPSTKVPDGARASRRTRWSLMLPVLLLANGAALCSTGRMQLVVDAGAAGAAILDIVSTEQPKSTSRTLIWAVLSMSGASVFESPGSVFDCPDPRLRFPRSPSSISQPDAVSNYRFLNVA